MKLFSKRGSKTPRRSTRISMLRFRKIALAGGTALLVLGGGFYGWHSGAFVRAAGWTHDKALALSASAGFRVNQILVTGREHVPPDVLMARLDLKQGEPIFEVPIGDAQKSLTDISWVKSARVTRRLPDTIIVDLEERAPAALWQHQKEISVIDEDGRVLSSDGRGAFQSLPLVVGENAPEHLTGLLTLLHAEPLVAKELVSAVRVGQRRWDLHLKNDITVKLPEKNAELALSELARRAKRDDLLKKDVTSIDMRIPDEIVVRPAQDAQDKDAKENKKKT
ncbi:MAG: FtsQ-type POTRA domain-containing protein [Alphaproteobacteria bacterium]|nr:FtsQ-type POTRA domain-containing protein [Alphaproteobacteria bacterium]